MLEYQKGDGFVHRLDPLTKLIWLVVVSVLVLVTTNMYLVLAMFLFVFFVHAASRLPLRKSPLASKFMLLLASLLVIFHGFFYPGGETAIYSLLGQTFTFEGVFFGIAISLRLLTLLTAASLFVMSTKPTMLVARMGRHLPDDIGFVFMNAMTSVPSLQRDMTKIIHSQVSRGMRFQGLKGTKSYFPVIVPLLSKALEGAKYLAFSIESRGFGLCKMCYEGRMGRNDVLFLVLPVIIGITCYFLFMG
ncbi:MAG: energy-coupling factor transporter transmembrane protein EcfT [Candidatus Aenigmarchaeota archaeon]|nr:energy-coupling factor transporter transmembrane protein EcfT [Candidatus Aenigmarchaeota archaeon]